MITLEQAKSSQYRTLRLYGRYLMTASSADLSWMNEGKTNVLPLTSSPDLDTDYLAFVIEAEGGYLVLPHDAELLYEQVGQQPQRFEVQILGFQVSQPA